MARVLIVDDEAGIRSTLARILERDGHECATAESAAAAVQLLTERRFDVVVSDILMPGGSGMELLRSVRVLGPGTQVILLTGEPTLETASEAVRGGAFDYLDKPVPRSRLTASVAAAARVARLEEENRTYREGLEQLVEARTRKLEETLGKTVLALSRAMEVRDPYTAGHQRRVAQLACAIHARLDLPADSRNGLRIAALLHDIGKISVPSEILAKPGRLSGAEIALVKEHPVTGWEILRDVDFPWPVADWVRQHHERLDGTGYPDGLAGDAIAVEARILSVADVVEAVGSHRPYRPALGARAATEVVVAGRGRHFDERVVDASVELLGDGGFSFEPD